MIKIGAEVILSVIVAPFLLWVTVSIFNLQATTGTDLVRIEQIKDLLEKQDKKIDQIMTILIEKKE